MPDTNIVIRAAVEGYIVSVNSPRQNVMEAISEEPHVFLTLADVVTFLTEKVLIEDVEAAPVDTEDETMADPNLSQAQAQTSMTAQANTSNASNQ